MEDANERLIRIARQWEWLHLGWCSLLERHPECGSIVTERGGLVPSVRLVETLRMGEGSEDVVLVDYSRCFDGSRTTLVDRLGFVGTTLTDLSKRVVVLTEGVSDFMSTKMFLPRVNVWGRTKVSVTALQLHVLSQLFDDVVVVADNDSTGIKKGFMVKERLERKGLRCRVLVSHNKDITMDWAKGQCDLPTQMETWGLLRRRGAAV